MKIAALYTKPKVGLFHVRACMLRRMENLVCILICDPNGGISASLLSVEHRFLTEITETGHVLDLSLSRDQSVPVKEKTLRSWM